MKLYEGTEAVVVAEIDERAFSEQRRGGIGGTDISAIAGLNPWKSALAVYYEKTTGAIDDNESERMAWGKRLEPVIAEETANREGMTIREVPYILGNLHAPHFRAAIDRLIIDDERGNGVLEVKNMGHWTSRQVRDEAGEDAVPDHYLLQIQWYLYVTGLRWGVFSALMEGCELRTVEVERDDALIADLVSLAEGFWKCIEDGTPPAADGSESTKATLERMFPVPKPGANIDLDPEEYTVVFKELFHVKEAIKPLEKRKKELEHQLKLAIGDAETATCGTYSATLKLVERKGYVVEPSSHRRLTVK